MYVFRYNNAFFLKGDKPVEAVIYGLSFNGFMDLNAATYPSVVMVTMVYQNAAGMLVNLLAVEPFSA